MKKMDIYDARQQKAANTAIPVHPVAAWQVGTSTVTYNPDVNALGEHSWANNGSNFSWLQLDWRLCEWPAFALSRWIASNSRSIRVRARRGSVREFE
jgi:hypothetical protein